MIHDTSIVTEIMSSPSIVHCSSILDARENYLCVWYEGPYETSEKTILKLAYKKKESRGWELPKILFDFHGLALGNPVLWKITEDHLFLTFPVLLSSAWTESLLFYSHSSDGGNHWQPPSLFLPKKGFMPKTRPILPTDGPILFPLYHEKEFCPYVMLIDDPWEPLSASIVGETMARGKVIQPALVERDSRSILMFARSNQGTIWKSVSYNRGYSWSLCTPTAIPNPNSAIDLVRMGEHLCLVYNDASNHRRNIRISLSKDGGRTWYASRRIDGGEEEYSYPSLWAGQDGVFHLTYTVNRYQIRYTCFDIEWVEKNSDLDPFQTE